MKNPLRKRLWRELKTEFGKYLVIFLLMVLSISFVSGFLVADGSMLTAYENSFEKYNVEDGHFTVQSRINKSQRKSLESDGVTIYSLFYAEEELTNGSTLRIYQQRDHVNKVCLMEGVMPEKVDEIAIDRMYADNNQLSVGDTISSTDQSWTVTGLVALSDYSALFADNADSMFDAMEFGVAVVTEECFERFSDEELTYCYAWKYDTSPTDVTEEKEAADDFMSFLNDELNIQKYVPCYLNQAIQFTGEDMGQDRAMMTALLYIIIVILAFVFVILTNDTIAKEANVIGTLRASGYTRRELVKHYMAMPVLVTVISAVLGNILGYTVLKNVCAGMYYGSYSLPTYVTIWNAEAFVLTTVIPVIIMMVLNWVVLRSKLSLSALRFLRRDISSRRQRKAIPLSAHLRFFSRFRIRVILQNISSYVILFIGILFANLLLMFGMCFPSILSHYQEHLDESMFCEYQYMLTLPDGAVDDDSKWNSMLAMLDFSRAAETENEDAEKFSAYSLQMEKDDGDAEEILLYGIREDSAYLPLEVSEDQIYMSSAYADKCRLSVGDTVYLKEPYEDTIYDFTITGIYDYDAGLNLVMSQSQLNERMGWEDDFFCGYFSDTEITDIDGEYIGSVIDYQSLTKISRQLSLSMGEMMYLVDGFSVIIFLVLIYLLSKLIIEKNAQSISMAKILGYSNGEIGRLYIMPTSIVVVLCLLITLPLCSMSMEIIFALVMQMMTGWIPWYLDPAIFGKMFLIGVISYMAVAILELRKIRKVPMDTALKNVE